MSRNRRRFNLWVIALALAYSGTVLVVHSRAALPAALPALLVGVTALLALQAARTYLRVLREADELLRKIETEALAVGFGVGAMLSLFSPLLAELGLPAPDATVIAAVMLLSWGIGSRIGSRRYAGSGDR